MPKPIFVLHLSVFYNSSKPFREWFELISDYLKNSIGSEYNVIVLPDMSPKDSLAYPLMGYRIEFFNDPETSAGKLKELQDSIDKFLNEKSKP